MEEQGARQVGKNDLSRRRFIQGIALVGATATTSTLLAGCGNKGAVTQDSSVSTDEVVSADGASAPNAQAIPPVAEPAAWDYEADVVVVGTGAGGIVAALRAATNGASVVVLEKAATPGGTSQETNIFNVVNTRFQEKAGIPKVDPSALLVEYASAQRFGAEADLPLLVSNIAANSAAADWMEDMGVKWQLEEECYGLPGLCWEGSEAGNFEARATKQTLDFLVGRGEEEGVQYLLATPAKALITDGSGRVIGAQAQTESGQIIHVKGNKGVLLATGGMEHNRDLMAQYLPSGLRCLNATGSINNTGDGIRMGMGAGAAIAGFDSFMAFDGGMETENWAHYLYAGDVQLVRQPWLGINNSGVRYKYWSLNEVSGTAAPLAASTLLSQPGNRGYVFFDADYETNITNFNEYMCRRPITPDMADKGADLDRMPEAIGPHDWRTGANNALEKGVIKKADTIEGLAVQLGFDPIVLQVAIDNWNSMCATGEDPQFNFPKKWLMPIVKAPFYGAAVGATILHTSTGLYHNPQQEVIDTTGRVIPGLYVSGYSGGGQSGLCSNGFPAPPSGVMYSAATGYKAVNSILGLQG